MILQMIPMSRTQKCVKKHHSPDDRIDTSKDHQILRLTRQEEDA